MSQLSPSVAVVLLLALTHGVAAGRMPRSVGHQKGRQAAASAETEVEDTVPYVSTATEAPLVTCPDGTLNKDGP